MTFTLWSIGFTVSRYEAVDSDIGLVDDEDDPAFGNDYVEFETQVLVRGAEKTLSAFQAGHKHATTHSNRINQRGIAITSSERVKKAYDIACAANGGIFRFPKNGVAHADD